MSNWAIERTVVTRAMASFFNPSKPWVKLVPGEYTQLRHRVRGVVMSDMPHDFALHQGFIDGAYGDVLVTGLGLGLVVRELLKNSAVRSITVIEKEAEVIALAGASVADPKVEIIHADALTYEPSKRFDCAWHDIWDTVEPHHIPLMWRIRKHYAPWCGWQALWGEPEAHAMSGKSPLVFALRMDVTEQCEAIASGKFIYPIAEPMTVQMSTHLANRDENTVEHAESYRMFCANGKRASDFGVAGGIENFIRANFPGAGELVRAGFNRQVQPVTHVAQTRYATPHVDHDFAHYVFICYLNTNNGVTRLFNRTGSGYEEIVQIKPERGLVIGFDGACMHSSSLATDAAQRNVAVLRFKK